MALTITKLKMWKDPGYTRGCLEVPPAGSKKLPAPDYTLAADETLRPHKGSTLTELHLPLSFTETFDMSYLYIEAEDGKGTIALFGWITSVTQRSTSAEGIVLTWDVDWWRSYSGSVTWGAGIVKRCNDSTYKRPYRIEPRKWKITNFEPIRPSGLHGNFTVVLSYNETDSDSGVTYIRFLYWNCSINTAESHNFNGTVKYALTLYDIGNGLVDEYLGLDPESINAIYVLPFTMGFVGYYEAPDGVHFAHKGVGSHTQSFALTNTYYSDDMRKTVIMDPDGGIVATMPWGFTASHMHICVDAGTIGGYAVGVFTTKTSPTFTKITDTPPGLIFTIPGITLPFNSNAYSSYNYSGEREYEKEMRQLSTNQKAISGGTSAAVEGAAAAALLALIPGVGALLGGMSGVSAGSTAITAGTDYLLETFVFNDQIQYLDDQKHSNQTSNIIQSAGGLSFADSMVKPNKWVIVQLEADDTSTAEYSNDIALNGYETAIPTSSVSSYITAGGPLQIINLNLTGNAPPAAKQFIKSKLESGVHITEKNPSGVMP